MIGVIADTHIPDRRRGLHPEVKPIFEGAGVTQILHAGDISVPKVLDWLAEIAPVVAVRGNRDLFPSPKLPLTEIVQVAGKRIGLTHGHGSFGQYMRDKLNFMLGRYKGFDFFADRAIAMLPPDVDVVVFGHNHAPMNEQRAGQLIFNPGSACCHLDRKSAPSIGLLQLSENEVRGEIHLLEPITSF